MKIKWSRNLDGTARHEEAAGPTAENPLSVLGEPIPGAASTAIPSKKSGFVFLPKLFGKGSKKASDDPTTFERNSPRRASDISPRCSPRHPNDSEGSTSHRRRRQKNVTSSPSKDSEKDFPKKGKVSRPQEHRKVCGSAPNSPLISKKEVSSSTPTRNGTKHGLGSPPENRETDSFPVSHTLSSHPPYHHHKSATNTFIEANQSKCDTTSLPPIATIDEDDIDDAIDDNSFHNSTPSPSVHPQDNIRAILGIDKNPVIHLSEKTQTFVYEGNSKDKEENSIDTKNEHELLPAYEDSGSNLTDSSFSSKSSPARDEPVGCTDPLQKLVSCLRNPKFPPRAKRRVRFAQGTKGDEQTLVTCRLLPSEGSEAQTSMVDVVRQHLPSHQVTVTRHVPEHVHLVEDPSESSDNSCKSSQPVCQRVLVEDQTKLTKITPLLYSPEPSPQNESSPEAKTTTSQAPPEQMKELSLLLESLEIPSDISINNDDLITINKWDFSSMEKKNNEVQKSSYDSGVTNLNDMNDLHAKNDSKPRPFSKNVVLLMNNKEMECNLKNNFDFERNPRTHLNGFDSNSHPENGILLSSETIPFMTDEHYVPIKEHMDEILADEFMSDKYSPLNFYSTNGTASDVEHHHHLSLFPCLPRTLEPILEDDASEDSALSSSDSAESTSSNDDNSLDGSFGSYPLRRVGNQSNNHPIRRAAAEKEDKWQVERRKQHAVPSGYKQAQQSSLNSSDAKLESTTPCDISPYCLLSLATTHDLFDGLVKNVPSHLLISSPTIVFHRPLEIIEDAVLERHSPAKNALSCYAFALERESSPFEGKATIFTDTFSPSIFQDIAHTFDASKEAMGPSWENVVLVSEPSVRQAPSMKREPNFACLRVCQNPLVEEILAPLSLSPISSLLGEMKNLKSEIVDMDQIKRAKPIESPHSLFEPGKKEKESDLETAKANKCATKELNVIPTNLSCTTKNEDDVPTGRMFLHPEPPITESRKGCEADLVSQSLHVPAAAPPVVDISIKADRVSFQVHLSEPNSKKAAAADKQALNPAATFSTRQELAQEIARLGSLCESRTKELNLLKLRLRHAVLGFDAFAVVVKYMAEELKAFSHPSLAEKLQRTEEELRKAELQLENYQKELKFLKEQHANELTELSKRLEQTHQKALDQLFDKHKAEITALKLKHSEEVKEIAGKYSLSFEGEDASHDQNVKMLNQQFNRQIEELEQEHKRQLSSRQADYERHLASLTQQIARIRQQSQALRCNLAQMEENFHKDADSKVQWLLSKKSELEKEVDSLKAVLEMKNSELHSLRTENMENKKELEKMALYKEKIKMLEAKTEDLQALVDEKVRVQRELCNEHQQLRDHFEKEAMVNKRLSMENEELVWKLKQTAETTYLLSSMSGDSTELMEKLHMSPLKSPPSSPTKIFFQYAPEPDSSSPSPLSPRSPIRKIPCPQPSGTSPVHLAIPTKKSKLSASSSLPADTSHRSLPPKKGGGMLKKPSVSSKHVENGGSHHPLSPKGSNDTRSKVPSNGHLSPVAKSSSSKAET